MKATPLERGSASRSSLDFSRAAVNRNGLSGMIGRVSPCAPQAGADFSSGAHGVTRPTCRADDVSKFVHRFTRLLRVADPRSAKRPGNFQGP
jgi:hypothetical protein